MSYRRLSFFFFTLVSLITSCGSSVKKPEKKNEILPYKIGKMRPSSFNTALWDFPTENWADYDVILKDDRYPFLDTSRSNKAIVVQWSDPCFPQTQSILRIHPEQLQILNRNEKGLDAYWAQPISLQQYRASRRMLQPIRPEDKTPLVHLYHPRQLKSDFPIEQPEIDEKNKDSGKAKKLSAEELNICQQEGQARRLFALSKQVVSVWNQYFGARVEKIALPSFVRFRQVKHRVITNDDFQELQTKGELKGRKLQIIP